MLNDPYKLIEMAIYTAGFLLVGSIWCGLVWLWYSRRRASMRKIENRLSLGQANDAQTRTLTLWYGDREVTTQVPDRVRPSIASRWTQFCSAAGLEASAGTVAMMTVCAAGMAAAGGFLLTGRALAAPAAALGVLGIIWIYLNHRIEKQAARFDLQLVDALELAARSLRAGHPLIGAFRLASDEIAAPVGPIFARICQEQDMGKSLEDALNDVAGKSTSSDLKLFATSVVIQLRSGGNLADMMERVSSVMRDRMRLSRRTRVLTAQTQYSKRILIVMPFAIFGVLNLLNPQYMEPLYSTSQGQTLLMVASVSLMLGILAMRRLVVVKY